MVLQYLKSRGEIKMFKNKKFVIMLAILVLSTVLLAGSVMGQENSATVSGTLKAVDVNAGTVMIATISGDQLLLKLTDESKIQIGGSASDLTQLAAKIDSKVNVEYQVEANAVTVISIE
jgi:hypothetical protein